MRLIKFGEKCSIKKTVMLGFFDCMHLGHRALLKFAEKYSYEKCIFTFSDFAKLKHSENVFTFLERLSIFESAGIDSVIYADFTKDFANIKPLDFLNYLKNDLNMRVAISGEDYNFGKNAKGDSLLIKDFCQKNRLEYGAVQPVFYNDQKISSTLIKTLLKQGDIKLTNLLLGSTYFIDSTVESGRKVGREIGFPTANLSFAENKSQLKDGVYSGYSYIDNKKYNAVINCGTKPTFDVYKKNAEAHFIGLDKDLYGQNLRLHFTDFLRPIIKFNSVYELSEQIKKDCQAANKN